MTTEKLPQSKSEREPRGKLVATIGKPRILLAEDDKDMRNLLSWQLRNSGFEVIECSDGFELLDHLGTPALSQRPDDFDLIISDIRMPGASGLEVLEGIHECEWYLPMILITAFGSKQTHQQADKWGAAAVFDKPFEIQDLILRIREVLALDSPDGSSWLRRESIFPIENLPIDIIFSHMSHSSSTEMVVHSAAETLEPFKDKIIYCRVIIEASRRPGNGKRYHVQVMVTLPNQVLVVRSNLRMIADEAALHAAIPEAFDAILTKLKNHFESKA